MHDLLAELLIKERSDRLERDLALARLRPTPVSRRRWHLRWPLARETRGTVRPPLPCR